MEFTMNVQKKNDIFFPNSLRDTRSFVELLFYLFEKLDQNFSRISLANYIGNVILENIQLE